MTEEQMGDEDDYLMTSGFEEQYEPVCTTSGFLVVITAAKEKLRGRAQ